MSRSRERRRQLRPPLTDARAEEVKAAYRIFETSPMGRTVLEDLCDSFYDRPSFVPGDPAGSTEFREGQRSVVAMIFEVLEDLHREKKGDDDSQE